MINKVYADTSALIGLIDKNDGLFPYAKQVLKSLLEKGYFIYTNQWVEYETLTGLREKDNSLCDKYCKIKEKINLIIDPVDSELESSSIANFWKYSDKKWSVIDCTIITAMWKNRIYYIFGCDHHFEQAGLFPLIKYTDGTPEITIKIF